ncbi:MAG TPA: hypothetical protein VKD70_15855 [Candidatus Acidoferrum sp.]|nr:hypothetical protein [Candidatus Acidoferrum sp.]
MVRIVDDIGTAHSVKVRAESLYEATLLGLNALSRVGWEGDGDTVGSVLVEVHYEPTSHEVDVPKFLAGSSSAEEIAITKNKSRR